MKKEMEAARCLLIQSHLHLNPAAALPTYQRHATCDKITALFQCGILRKPLTKQMHTESTTLDRSNVIRKRKQKEVVWGAPKGRMATLKGRG